MEKVWLAEKAAEEERQRLQQLQQEIRQERSFEDLKRISHKHCDTR